MREKHYYLTEERIMLFSHLHLESMPTEYREDVIIDSFENPQRFSSPSTFSLTLRSLQTN